MINNGLPLEHPDYEITCNYEFLEDINTDWGQELGQMRRKTHLNEAQRNARNNRKVSVMTNMRVPVTDYAKKQFELKENHPLMVMVSFTYITLSTG